MNPIYHPFAVLTAQVESVICHHREERREKVTLSGGQGTSGLLPQSSLFPVLTVMQAVTSAAAVAATLCQQWGNQRPVRQ